MEFRSARTVDEAVDVLADEGSDVQILAGGTDVMIQRMRGELDPAILLHVARIPALGEIANGTGLRIGSGVTHQALTRHPAVATQVPALAQAAATVGGWQTQVVGTVGGNLCNASPAADTIPPLLVANAAVVLDSHAGSRTIDAATFVTGRRSTERRPDELVTALHLDPLGANAAEVYLKVGPRRAMEVALVGLAVRVELDAAAQTATDVRIAACAVAPRPFRASTAEHLLIGSSLDAETIRAAGDALAAQADPIDDARASASYRRRVLGPLLARAVDQCRQIIMESKP